MKKIILVALPLMLAACSIFSPYGTSNIPDPAPLPKYTPQVAPKIVWSKNVGAASNGSYLHLTPTVMNNVVYTISQNGQFQATSLDGKTLWEKRFDLMAKSNLASNNGVIAFVDSKAILHVINADKGEPIWQATLSSQSLAAPTFTSNLILTKSIDGMVTAFDRISGQQKWQYQHQEPTLMLHASSSILVNGNLAYVGFTDGKVVALNLATGDEVWSQQAAEAQGFAENQRMVDIDANLILQNNRLFVATYQGQVAALSPTTGAVLWQQANSVYANIAVSDHLLFAISNDGTITAYQQDSGKVVWEQKDLAWRFLTGAINYQNMLVVADGEGYVHFLKPQTGELLGFIQADKGKVSIIDAPMILDQSLFVIDTQGKLVDISIAL